MSAKFEIGGDASGAVRAVEALNKAIAATAKGAEGAITPTKKLQESVKRLSESADPQEKFNRKMRELAEAVNHGGLEIGKAQTIAQRYQQQLDGVSKAGDKAFGMDSIASVGKMGAEILGISSALNLAIQGMKEFDAERKKAADDALRARQGVGQLAQLAASDKDPAQAYKDLVAEADIALQRGAAADRNEAATLIFDLAAAGIDRKDRDFAVGMRASGTLTNVGGLAGAYDAARTSMGAAEVGSFEEFASKALAAGAAAPGTVEQLPVALSKAMGTAKALGLSDESVLAGGAILAKQAGSSSEGGTKMAALLSGIEKSGVNVKGMTFTEMIEALQKENTNSGGIFKDNQEAISAFRTISANITPVKELQQDIYAAQSEGLAGKAMQLPNLDDSQRAANMRAQSEGQLAETNEKTLSRAENLRQAALADWSATRRKKDPGLWTETQIFFERMGQEIPLFGDPTRALEQTQNGNMPVSDPKLNQEIRDLLKQIAENTGSTDKTTKAKVTTRPE